MAVSPYRGSSSHQYLPAVGHAWSKPQPCQGMRLRACPGHRGPPGPKCGGGSPRYVAAELDGSPVDALAPQAESDDEQTRTWQAPGKVEGMGGAGGRLTPRPRPHDLTPKRSQAHPSRSATPAAVRRGSATIPHAELLRVTRTGDSERAPRSIAVSAGSASRAAYGRAVSERDRRLPLRFRPGTPARTPL